MSVDLIRTFRRGVGFVVWVMRMVTSWVSAIVIAVTRVMRTVYLSRLILTDRGGLLMDTALVSSGLMMSVRTVFSVLMLMIPPLLPGLAMRTYAVSRALIMELAVIRVILGLRMMLLTSEVRTVRTVLMHLCGAK